MIKAQYFWTCIGLLTLGTFAIRYSFIGLSDRMKITDRYRELFTYIPAAVFPAIAVPVVFYHQGSVEWLHGKERLFVLILSVVVSFLFRNLIVSLCFGLIALYLLTQMI